MGNFPPGRLFSQLLWVNSSLKYLYFSAVIGIYFLADFWFSAVMGIFPWMAYISQLLWVISPWADLFL